MTYFLVVTTLSSLALAVRTHRAFKSVYSSFQSLYVSYLEMEKSKDAWKKIAQENSEMVKHNFDAHWDAEVHRAVLDSPFSEPRTN